MVSRTRTFLPSDHHVEPARALLFRVISNAMLGHLRLTRAVKTECTNTPQAGVAGTLFSPDGENPPPPGDATTRSPAASLGVLVMSQLQFLAILSLVDSVRDSSSLLSSFVENLR